MQMKKFGMILFMFALAGTAQAATVTWDGSGDRNWKDNDNTSWGGATYSNGDTAVFTATGAGNVTNDAAGVLPGAVNVTGGSYTFSGGSIGGTGALTMSSSGCTLTLTASNAFTGGIVINAGTLEAATSAWAFGTSNNVTFGGSGGTLRANSLDNTTFKFGTLAVNPGATAYFYSYAGAVQYFTFTNTVGPGTIASQPYGPGPVCTLGDASGFTGSLGGSGGTFAFTTLADTAGSYLYAGNTYQYNGSTTMAMTNRVLSFSSTYNMTLNGSGNWSIGKDMINTGGGNALTLGGSGANSISGKLIDGTGALSVTVAGSWTLSGSNTYSGTTAPASGILSFNSIGNVNGGPSALGNPSSVANGTMVIGNGNNITLLYTGSGHSSDRVINIHGSSSAIAIQADGTGPLVLNGSVTRVWSGAETLTLKGRNSGSNTIAGAIADGGGGTIALAKYGIGTWVLSGSNTFTGGTSLNGGGTLILDYSTQNNSKLADGQVLTLGDGKFTLSGGSHTEIVASTTMVDYRGTIVTRSGGSSVLQMGSLTRPNGGATLSVSEDFIATTSTLNNNGIIGPWATVGSNWAVNSNNAANGPIVGLTSYTALPTAGASSTVNYQLTGSQAQGGAADTTVNTLRLVNSANSDTLALGARHLLLNSGNGVIGGLLYAGGFDNNYTITGTGAVKAATPNNHLAVNVFTGTLTVTALLNAGSASTVKFGAGTLVVGSDNTGESGTIFVQEGTLRLLHSKAAGDTSSGIWVQNGAALELTNNLSIGAESLTITGSGVASNGALRSCSGTEVYGGAISLGTGGARINADSGSLLILNNTITTASGADLTVGGAGNVVVSNVISGAGALIKDGAGAITLSGFNTYSGTTTISAGTLTGITGDSCINSAVTVADGATLGVSVTDNTKQWVCSSLTVSAGTAAQLSFSFTDTPSTNLAPLKITGNLTFSGTPTVVVTSSSRIPPGTYALLSFSGTAPTAVPALSGVLGFLSWGVGGDKTLYLNVSIPGMVITVR